MLPFSSWARGRMPLSTVLRMYQDSPLVESGHSEDREAVFLMASRTQISYACHVELNGVRVPEGWC